MVLRIRGSFISLFNSKYARAKWRYGSPCYEAPIRDWGFDPDLLEHHKAFDANLLPAAVYVHRVIWRDSAPSVLD